MKETGREAPPITFLVYEISGSGGIVRTVVALANHLSGHRKVRVISLYRTRTPARHPLNPAVELTVLRDLTKRRGPLKRRVLRLIKRMPSRLEPRPRGRGMSLLTDLLIRRALHGVRSGVIVSTRPALHLASVTFARPEVITVGWDHGSFPARFGRNTGHRRVLSAAIPRLDGLVVLTKEDAAQYRQHFPEIDTVIDGIPNSVPWPIRGRGADVAGNRIIVAIGRYVRRKRFPLLVRAFAQVARDHPEWQLHLYGWGAQRAKIQSTVRALHLGGQVKVHGYTDDVPGALNRAAAFAMTSDREGFPMVLLEAMSHGLPLIAYDCPHGPAEIIKDGDNGLLIPDVGRAPYVRGLRRLVEDDQLRVSMGAQALRDAHQYDVARVGERWERLFDELARRRRLDNPADIPAPRSGEHDRAAVPK